MAQLERTEKQARDNKSEAEKKVSELNSEIKKVQSAIFDLENDCWEMHFCAITELVRSMNEMSLRPKNVYSSLGSIEGGIKVLRDSEKDLKRSNEILREDVEGKEKIIAGLQGRYQSLCHAYKELMNQKAERDGKYSRLLSHEVMLSDRNSQLEDLNNQLLVKMEKEVSKLEKDIGKLEKDKAKVIENNKKLRKANKSLQHSAKKLKTSLMELETQVKTITFLEKTLAQYITVKSSQLHKNYSPFYSL